MKVNVRNPRLVIVTGAGSGIGRATAIGFAKLGADVVVSDIDLDAAQATAAMIRGHGGRATAYALDVTDPEAWKRFGLDVHADHGVADVLVNNAGIVVGGRFLDYKPEDWDRQLGVNLMGVVHGCRVIGAQMVERGEGGHIVNIASAAAFTPTPVMSAYSVSKAGVKMLSECLRLEFGPHRIGVTAICPGVINTNIGANGVMVGIEPDLIERGKAAAAQLQRLGVRIGIMSPDLVARAVVRSVRFDLAVVPVRSEAWLGYVASRVAPGINRRLTAPFTVDRLHRSGDRLLSFVSPRPPRRQRHDPNAPTRFDLVAG
jgi:NAD(P)-dependent dehydrogenase (short-subunit alcohol dehydrogenase family)